jgi:drug/metabolite transporter (DMT)-like permease
LAVLIFGASSAITRKITELGAQHFMHGENPISLCNVLFVGNLCALLVFIVIYRHQLKRKTLSQLCQREWLSLAVVAVLAGALAPGLIFQALSTTSVTNVVLLGRLEPPLTLALSVWWLRERVNRWEWIGAIVAFVGVSLSILLQPVHAIMTAQSSVSMGLGELQAALGAGVLAIATILGKQHLAKVPLGIYSVVRTGLGTIVFFIIAMMLYGSHHFAGVFSPFLWKWMLLYGVVIVVVGQSFWIAGLRASSVSKASVIGSLSPIAGILAAYFILDEVPVSAHYIGGGIILLGLVLSRLGIRRYSSRSTQSKPAKTAEGQIQTGFRGI